VIPLEDARSFVLSGCRPAAPAEVPLREALGLVLSRDVFAPEDIPPFPNTAVDGFAVRAADVAAVPRTLRVVGTLPAGAAPDRAVGEGEAIRIMTGAPMPPGADAVVMVEVTELAADGASVLVRESVDEGAAVRAAGEDVRAGQLVFEPGTILGAGHLGVLSSLGMLAAPVRPRPRVGVLSTGDELIEGPAPLQPGQIRDSNRVALLALLARAGCTGVDLGLVPDTEADITAAIEKGVAECDALVTSGGVSMGAFDYVKVVLDRIGDMRWMQVAIRPAKPLAFGTVDGKPVFGLPGNPVSSMVSFELFARPALRKMMGVPERLWVRPSIPAVADEPMRRRADGKTHFNRVVASVGADGRHHVRSAGGQGSHQLTAMANADALAVLHDGPGVDTGGLVDVLLLD
jgi:molybdenum cofactor synthesis domain-containing protein